jgi:hypothetical protein
LAPIPQSPLTAIEPSGPQDTDTSFNIQQNNTLPVADEASSEPPPVTEDLASQSIQDEVIVKDDPESKGLSTRESDSVSLNDRSLQDKDSSTGDKSKEL